MRSRGSTIFKKTDSANLGAGMKGYDIGFSLGLTAHATDDVKKVIYLTGEMLKKCLD